MNESTQILHKELDFLTKKRNELASRTKKYLDEKKNDKNFDKNTDFTLARYNDEEARMRMMLSALLDRITRSFQKMYY